MTLRLAGRCLSRHGVSSAVKKAQAKGWRQWLEEELNWEVPEGSFWQDESWRAGWALVLTGG